MCCSLNCENASEPALSRSEPSYFQRAACSEMREKLTKRMCIATVNASAARAPFEEGGYQLIVELVNDTSPTNQPVIEQPKQLQL